MKAGIYIGGFCPLHRGHLDVIMRAKKENNKCFIIVYGYDNEQRSQEIGMTTLDRYNIISDFFQKDEQVIVKIANYKIKPDWDILLNDVLNITKCNKKDVIIYTGEPVYHQCLINWGFNCVFVKTCVPTNGTNIRKNPYNYIDFIAEPFKKCFKKYILLTGTSCEGKSTCAADLAKYFNAGYSCEYSRKYVTVQKMSFADCTTNHIRLFMKGQCNQTANILRENLLTFADGDAITNLSYAKLFAEQKIIPMEEYVELETSMEWLLLDYNKIFGLPTLVNKIFMFAPKEKFIDDGVRGVVLPFEVRKRHFEILCELYEKYKMQYTVLKGTYYENFEFIKDHILKAT